MDLNKVLKEIETEGEYWRGDTRVWLGKDGVYCEYLPKEGYSQKEILKRKGNLKPTLVNGHLKVKAESLEEVVSFVNSIEYPDVHVTKRAGCKIKIQDGKVAKIGKPKILHCSVAEERYGRPRCRGCKEVKPFLKKEFEGKIEEGMFTERRKICERKAMYTYGASEMLMDALREKVIDACVVVCDGAGTVIVNEPEITQGIGEKMTGVFYTSPHEKLIKRLEKNSFVLFPETARIDQIEGVRASRKLGYERVAVTTADNDSKNLSKIKGMDEKITTLALCTSGIEEGTAKTIKEHADLAWACGSKYVREIVGPEAWVQLGTRLPVFVLTKKGFELAVPRIKSEFGYERISLDPGRKYYNLKEVNELPVRSREEPYPLI